MKRFFIFALFLVSLLACTSAPPPAPPSPPPTIAATSLVEMSVALVGEGGAYCSATWVSGWEILTAAHCVRGLNLGDVVPYATAGDVNGDEVSPRNSTLRKLDELHDLALLYAFLPPPHPYARMGHAPVRGDRVYTLGHPLGLWWSFSSGDVAAIRYQDTGTVPEPMWWVQTTAPISPGNSGCGLFDQYLNLIGVAHGTYTRGDALHFFIHPNYVSQFLKN